MEIVTPDPDGTHNKRLCFFHATLSIVAEVNSVLELFSVWQSYLELLSDTSTGLDTTIILAIGCQ